MYYSSGIGVYLQNLLPRLAKTLVETKTTLLGSPPVLAQLQVCLPNAELRAVKSQIYSLSEQIEMPLRGSMGRDLWWSPHFNVPLAHPGPLAVTIHDLFHLANLRIASSPAVPLRQDDVPCNPS